MVSIVGANEPLFTGATMSFPPEIAELSTKAIDGQASGGYDSSKSYQHSY
jgi:hypothetical protein